MSEKNQSWLDQLFNQLIGDGDTSHLPGAGRPLNLDTDSHVPAEQRMANKIMQDHHVLPPWVQLGQELEAESQALLLRLRLAAQDYERRSAEARLTNDAALRQNAEQHWQQVCTQFRQDVAAYNKRLLTFNLSLPAPMPHRPLLAADIEIAAALKRA